MAVWTWLAGTRAGRWLLAVVAFALAILAALAAARREGVRAAREEMAERQARAVQDRRTIEEGVDALDEDDLRTGLSEWVRGPDR